MVGFKEKYSFFLGGVGVRGSAAVSWDECGCFWDGTELFLERSVAEPGQ